MLRWWAASGTTTWARAAPWPASTRPHAGGGGGETVGVVMRKGDRGSRWGCRRRWRTGRGGGGEAADKGRGGEAVIGRRGRGTGIGFGVGRQGGYWVGLGSGRVFCKSVRGIRKSTIFASSSRNKF